MGTDHSGVVQEQAHECPGGNTFRKGCSFYIWVFRCWGGAGLPGTAAASSVSAPLGGWRGRWGCCSLWGRRRGTAGAVVVVWAVGGGPASLIAASPAGAVLEGFESVLDSFQHLELVLVSVGCRDGLAGKPLDRPEEAGHLSRQTAHQPREAADRICRGLCQGSGRSVGRPVGRTVRRAAAHGRVTVG